MSAAPRGFISFRRLNHQPSRATTSAFEKMLKRSKSAGPEEILPLAEAIVRRDPEFFEAHMAVAELRARLHDVAGALAACREARAIDPRSPSALGLHAVLAYEAGNHDETVRDAKMAILLGNQSPWVHLVLGLSLHRRGEDEGIVRNHLKLAEPVSAIARKALAALDKKPSLD